MADMNGEKVTLSEYHGLSRKGLCDQTWRRVTALEMGSTCLECEDPIAILSQDQMSLSMQWAHHYLHLIIVWCLCVKRPLCSPEMWTTVMC